MSVSISYVALNEVPPSRMGRPRSQFTSPLMTIEGGLLALCLPPWMVAFDYFYFYILLFYFIILEYKFVQIYIMELFISLTIFFIDTHSP